MECIEARALKPSFLSQMAMKTNSQVYYNDDVWCLTGVNNVVSDDFPVEDLLNLDFPEKDFQGLCFSQEDEDVSQKGNSIHSSSSSSTFSGADDFDTLSAAELALPVIIYMVRILTKRFLYVSCKKLLINSNFLWFYFCLGIIG